VNTTVPNKISFLLAEIDGSAVSVTPCIDGRSLAELIAEFERSSGYTDPAGGYGGLVPANFNFGDFPRYFCGDAGNQRERDNDREIYVLSCECGELGCWPLMTAVTRVEAGYQWSTFRQPHRPQRNYEPFGPFVFDKKQYESAVHELALKFEATG
jgi:hypothetical protein